MHKPLIALLVAGLAAGTAQAQDTKWAGFHAGVGLGSTEYAATWTDTRTTGTAEARPTPSGR
jgi:hypothetical protein